MKKGLAVLLSVAMCASLTACGGGNDGSLRSIQFRWQRGVWQRKFSIQFRKYCGKHVRKVRDYPAVGGGRLAGK